MHRAIVFFIGLAICCFSSQCVKNNASPVTESQRLLMAKPWLLAYTDSITIDSVNNIHHYHSPALNCEKQESVVFGPDLNYYVQLVCNHPDSAKFPGVYYLSTDSTLAYETKTQADANDATLAMDISHVEIISTDSLKLIQQSNFATPGTYYRFFIERAYSH